MGFFLFLLHNKIHAIHYNAKGMLVVLQKHVCVSALLISYIKSLQKAYKCNTKPTMASYQNNSEQSVSLNT